MNNNTTTKVGPPMMIRNIPADLHQELRLAALKAKVSMNKYVIEAIRQSVESYPMFVKCENCQELRVLGHACNKCGHGGLDQVKGEK